MSLKVQRNLESVSESSGRRGEPGLPWSGHIARATNRAVGPLPAHCRMCAGHLGYVSFPWSFLMHREGGFRETRKALLPKFCRRCLAFLNCILSKKQAEPLILTA